jgi:hypothetical protein
VPFARKYRPHLPGPEGFAGSLTTQGDDMNAPAPRSNVLKGTADRLHADDRRTLALSTG